MFGTLDKLFLLIRRTSWRGKPPQLYILVHILESSWVRGRAVVIKAQSGPGAAVIPGGELEMHDLGSRTRSTAPGL